MKCKQKQRSGRDGPFKAMQDSLEKLDLFHSMEVLFLEYFHTTNSISILWNWRGKKRKLDFPTFFYNISTIFPIPWKWLFQCLSVTNTLLVSPNYPLTLYCCPVIFLFTSADNHSPKPHNSPTSLIFTNMASC